VREPDRQGRRRQQQLRSSRGGGRLRTLSPPSRNPRPPHLVYPRAAGAKLEAGWADFFLERKLDGERALIHWCRGGNWPAQHDGDEASSPSAAAADDDDDDVGAGAGSGKKGGGRRRGHGAGAGSSSSSSEPTWSVRVWGRDPSTQRKGHFEAALGPRVASALAGLEEAIIDGEMMVWDAKERAFLPLGQSKMAASYMMEDPDWASGKNGKHLCFMAFDLLWARGWPARPECDGALVDRPLTLRRTLLEAAVAQEATYFEVLPAKRVIARHGEVLADEFTAAIDR
jgi:ATP-dependent DNA ligase